MNENLTENKTPFLSFKGILSLWCVSLKCQGNAILLCFSFEQVYRRLSERLGLHDESNVLSVFMSKM